MFSRIRDFFYRHRRKFLVGGILFGGMVFLTRFTLRRIREKQEQEIRELLERSKRQQHFQCTERTCDQTILTLAVTLRKAVTKAIDTDAIVEQLKSGCDNKVVAWNKLKVLAFLKTTVIVYSYAMLVATLRIQLNLIGGYLYKDSAKRSEEALATEEIRQKYLSLCGYFMEEGIQKLSKYVEEKVTKITEKVSLKDELNLRDVEQIYWSIVSAIMMDADKDPIKNVSFYVIGPLDDEISSELPLKKMIDETVVLIQSDEIRHLIQNTIASGFHVIIDHISDYFVQNSGRDSNETNSKPGPSQSNSFNTYNNSNKSSLCVEDGLMSFKMVRKPMAKIIPILNGQVPTIPKKVDMPSDWLQRLIFNEKYKNLGANVYEGYSC